jgi:hypothetical protein
LELLDLALQRFHLAERSIVLLTQPPARRKGKPSAQADRNKRNFVQAIPIYTCQFEADALNDQGKKVRDG